MRETYIVIDTEGTGLFKHKEPMPDGTFRTVRSDEPGQPRMAEFAAVITDADFVVLDSYQQYILPDGWLAEDGKTLLQEMPPGAFEANKLTFDFLRANGRPVIEAVEYYNEMLRLGLTPLGFNMQFDGRQMRGEMRRAGLDDRFDETPNVCVMRSMQAAKIKVKKLNGKGGFPRLIDVAAHFNIPGYTEDKHHKADEDAYATAQVAKHLHGLGKLLPPAVYRSKHAMGEQS
jgi:DNA polymerase III subunit epsilon